MTSYVAIVAVPDYHGGIVVDLASDERVVLRETQDDDRG
jgi:hypothetical protein